MLSPELPDDSIHASGKDDRRARIEQALRELPLSDEDVARSAANLVGNFLLGNIEKVRDDSTLFDFRGKITAVVNHFARDGLALSDYLSVAVKQPQLFAQASATIIANVEAVVSHFAPHGLTLPDYLKAAVQRPSLFTWAPSTVITNVEAVASHFAPHGLTLSDYLRSAVQQPPLFSQAPATVIANVETVVSHFAPHGLTLSTYLKAAVKQPSLFSQLPATVIGHIEGVTEHFHGHGLMLSDYLRSAVQRPPLFSQAPSTVIGHVNQIIGLHRQGLITFPGQEDAPPHQPLKPLLDWLVKNPAYFSLADGNYTLREVATHAKCLSTSGTTLLHQPRYRVESALAASLGHADLRRPIPKEPSPEQGGDAGRHARNVLLRALIREGLVKGTLER